jgi:hypothetical protein
VNDIIVGATVIAINDKHKGDGFYPPVGTIGEAVYVSDDGVSVKVKWPAGTVLDDDLDLGGWWCRSSEVDTVCRPDTSCIDDFLKEWEG